MPPLISCQHERRHANDVNHVAFSTVCGFSETSSAIYLIKLRFHIVASGAHAAAGAVGTFYFRSISPGKSRRAPTGYPIAVVRNVMASRGGGAKKIYGWCPRRGRAPSITKQKDAPHHACCECLPPSRDAHRSGAHEHPAVLRCRLGCCSDLQVNRRLLTLSSNRHLATQEPHRPRCSLRSPLIARLSPWLSVMVLQPLDLGQVPKARALPGL